MAAKWDIQDAVPLLTGHLTDLGRGLWTKWQARGHVRLLMVDVP